MISVLRSPLKPINRSIMKNYFTITTNHETAKEIEKLRNSVVIEHRSLQIGDVDYSNPNFAIVKIIAVAENINPEDIFWLGYHTDKKTVPF